MSELFDYGGLQPPASPEVAMYEIEDDLIRTDWRQRASDHFRQVEKGSMGDNFGPAIGALSLALSSEKDIRYRTAEINHWEARLPLEHPGPDD